MYKKAVYRTLGRIQLGSLTWIDAQTSDSFGMSPEWARSQGLPVCQITIRDAAGYRQMVLGGDLGFAEALMDGHIRCDDLTSLVRLFILNIKLLDGANRGTANARKGIEWMGRLFKRNTRGQARRNIHQHYDLGNDFFRLFLDPSMNYSSAVFQRPDDSLLAGSIHKMWRLCRKLDLREGDHLLEIGTGWGGLALFAAEQFGCRVTTTTISEEQYLMARERVRRCGLDDRIKVIKKDYRQLEGTFDKLVSVEMIEAVGHQYFQAFFRQCAARLKPSGRMALQAIVIREDRYAHHLRNVDFIQKYIFPGGCLPSNSALLRSIAATNRLQLCHLEDLGWHYARTLNQWRHRFEQNRQAILELRPSRQFLRMWEYYLCYCEAAFLQSQVSVVQCVVSAGEGQGPLAPDDWELPRQRLLQLERDYLQRERDDLDLALPLVSPIE